jgi:hypothetical protein
VFDPRSRTPSRIGAIYRGIAGRNVSDF